MNKKIIYILIGLTYLSLRFIWPLQHIQKVQKPVHPEKRATKTLASKINPIITRAEERETSDADPKKFHASNSSTLKKVSFEQLPGWDTADVKKSLFTFQKSCATFLKQDPKHPVGTAHIDLQAGDWRPACNAALAIESISEEAARTFFEKWFSPIKFEQKKTSPGLFTGYYMPQFEGSLTRTAKFSTPIYGLPRDLHLGKKNYYTREEIDNGVLKTKAPVIAWINSPVERLFLEIEGSGVIKLTNGKILHLGYAGENGAPYTSIGSVLIKSGIMSRNNASKGAIKRYLENNPDKMNAILHKNKSFVFFQNLNKPIALGAKGTALTPGYSLAVDRKWIPLGAPLWLNTKKPDGKTDNDVTFQRLMIAQDTGGAIRGLMRGDVYWGSSKTASILGEKMKNKGRYWLLLPKFALVRLAHKFGVKS